MTRKRSREIWLLRHAKTEKGRPGISDEKRALTPGGRRKIRAMAGAIARLNPDFDAILTSPLLRARQTAQPVAKALDSDEKLMQTNALSPWADPKEILEEIEKRSLSRVLLVGHMPHLGQLLGYLLTGQAGTGVEFKKGALARVEFDGDALELPGTLTLFLTSKTLSRANVS